ncbi:hypothetical protein Q5741_04475 [Paenibacillus sp. JX-17]|uniref:Uncharacterized protein n=1 Tax=Paenibacillus lacisoli TaxID=3064525 RepID=A0ABT9CDA7_9BACL|nr:hypothetical protein [Paenibacillus sp. JX-17]MDO7905666.1 hypothetical protein [Paenibacillus sp. JX-17]
MSIQVLLIIIGLYIVLSLLLVENMQANPLFYLSNILASLIFRVKHPNRSSFTLNFINSKRDT